MEGLAVADLNGDSRPDLIGAGVGVWVAEQSASRSLAPPEKGNPGGIPPSLGIFINELMASNTEYYQAGNSSPDWLEIYNNTDSSADLSDWELHRHGRDGEEHVWVFPKDILVEAYERILVFCGGGGEKDDALTTGFALSRFGGGLSLVDPAGETVDRVDYPSMLPDVSYARFVDGARFFGYNAATTIGEDNKTPGNLNPGVRRRNPLLTVDTRQLVLTAETFDDTGIAHAAVFFRLEGENTFTELRMRDDGRNRDGGAGDGVFGVTLPPLSPGATIYYYVRVADMEGLVSLSPGPPGGATELLQVTLPPDDPGLRISEVLSDNQTGIVDEWGEYTDWIEIANCGDQTARLDGLSLTQNYFNPARSWDFPAGLTLAPQARLLVFCDNQTEDDTLHANFCLAREGDQVSLIREADERVLLDTLSFGALPRDTSFGIPACGEEPTILPQPTPGGANPGEEPYFRRGDTNADGTINLSDPIRTLAYLFAGAAEPPCLDAADADDSGAVFIDDSIFTLHYLFRNQEAPGLPFPACGPDPTTDDLPCRSFPSCVAPGGFGRR